MLLSVAANLIADLIWAPFAWAAYRIWSREWRRHRAEFVAMQQRVEDLFDDPGEGHK